VSRDGKSQSPQYGDCILSPRKSKLAPPGGREGEGWVADDSDTPVDDLFDYLKDDAT